MAVALREERYAFPDDPEYASSRDKKRFINTGSGGAKVIVFATMARVIREALVEANAAIEADDWEALSASLIKAAGSLPHFAVPSPANLAERLQVGLLTEADAWAELRAIPGFMEAIDAAKAEDARE